MSLIVKHNPNTGAREIARGDGARVAQNWAADGTGGHLFRDVTITSAQLLALFATPQPIVPAPGVGFANILDGIVAYKPAGVAYAGVAGGEDLSVKYTDGSGTELLEIETTGFLDQTTAQTRIGYPFRAASGISSVTPTANAALVMQILTGEITTGDSDLKLRVYYRILPTILA